MPPLRATPQQESSRRHITLSLVTLALVVTLVASRAYPRLVAATSPRSGGAVRAVRAAAAARVQLRGEVAADAASLPSAGGGRGYVRDGVGSVYDPVCQLAVDMPAGSSARRGAPPALVDISVSSEFSQRSRRDAVRAGYAIAARSLGMRVRFFVGEPQDAHDSMSGASEQRQYGDLVILPMRDTYENLTLKTLAMTVYTAACGDGEYYIKADDDVFVHAWHLRARLAQVSVDAAALYRRTLGVYMGTMWQDAPPILAWDNKNYEGNWVIRSVPANASVPPMKRSSHFTPYAGGPFYIMSRPAAEYLRRNARSVNTRWRNEDMAMGLWLRGTDVEFVSEPRVKVLHWRHSWRPYIALHNIDDRHRIGAWHAQLAANASEADLLDPHNG